MRGLQSEEIIDSTQNKFFFTNNVQFSNLIITVENNFLDHLSLFNDN